MAKQRYINTKFWSDNWVIELDPLERYLFLYFLTNEHTNIAGIYELPLRAMAFETGIDKEMLEKMIPRFAGKVYYIDGWVYLKNFAKHQADNESVKKGIKAALKNVPKEILEKVDSLGTGSPPPPTYLNLNSNLNSNSNPKIERQNAPNEDIRPTIDFFVRASEAIQGVKPVIDGGKVASLLKKRLEKDGIAPDRMELLIVWFLSRKKRYQDAKGNWQEKFKNSPDFAVMLSSSRFNELLSDEQNARSFMADNLEWADKIYKRAKVAHADRGFVSMSDLLLARMKTA